MGVLITLALVFVAGLCVWQGILVNENSRLRETLRRASAIADNVLYPETCLDYQGTRGKELQEIDRMDLVTLLKSPDSDSAQRIIHRV